MCNLFERLVFVYVWDENARKNVLVSFFVNIIFFVSPFLSPLILLCLLTLYTRFVYLFFFSLFFHGFVVFPNVYVHVSFHTVSKAGVACYSQQMIPFIQIQILLIVLPFFNVLHEIDKSCTPECVILPDFTFFVLNDHVRKCVFTCTITIHNIDKLYITYRQIYTPTFP